MLAWAIPLLLRFVWPKW